MKHQPLPFERYVLRAPLFSLDSIFELFSDGSPEAVLQLTEDLFFKEALYIASPELLGMIEKINKDPAQFSNEKKAALWFAILKYASRAASRCTPFGLFSGCITGVYKPKTSIKLGEKNQGSRTTQIDMECWMALLQDLAIREDVKPHLLYSPNNSLYSASGFYRYIDYKIANGKRAYQIVAVRKTPYLEKILAHSGNGLTIDQMAGLIADLPSEKEEAIDYVGELIASQILTSNLEAAITGMPAWERLLVVIAKIPALKKEMEILEKVKKLMSDLDNAMIPDPEIRPEIKLLLHKAGVSYDEKYLFQTDISLTAETNQLDQDVAGKTLRTLYFLNGIQPEIKNEAQQDFIKAFVKRYETREMPLTTVLDAETGIGYVQNELQKHPGSILEKFLFPQSNLPQKSETWKTADRIIQKKLQYCLENEASQLVLSETDFPDFKSDWDLLPATFSAMAELLQIDGKTTVFLASSGDSSAVKLLGRFCNVNPEIDALAKEIATKEKNFHTDKILAEIVHIPESRTGNVLRRPVLRDYEIAYLAAPGVSADFQIAISDLMVSVKENRIVLRSQKHNKEVLPMLSNAHNYLKSALPVYHFLCDLPLQGCKPVYSFSWGILEEHYIYFPRVLYKDVIISKAKWRIAQTEIAGFHKSAKSELQTNFFIWKQAKKLPRYVNFADQDQTILLDLERLAGIVLFLEVVRNLESFILEEFLFTGETIVKNAGGQNFTNQIIMPFYKEKIL